MFEYKTLDEVIRGIVLLFEFEKKTTRGGRIARTSSVGERGLEIKS